MLLEDNVDALVNTISGLSHIYKTTGFNVEVVRNDEDVDGQYPFIAISFLPSSKKIGMSLNNYLGKRDNINYNNYGYGEYERVIVRTFCNNVSGLDGRALSQAWSNEIESYIKNNWTNLITGGSVDMYSFSHRRMSNHYVDRRYGYELSFDVITTNSWTDEPVSGAIEPIEISGIRGDMSGYRIRVEL